MFNILNINKIYLLKNLIFALNLKTDKYDFKK